MFSCLVSNKWFCIFKTVVETDVFCCILNKNANIFELYSKKFWEMTCPDLIVFIFGY